MRDLNSFEIDVVSGGDIVVTGGRSSSPSILTGFGFGSVFGSGYSSIFEDIDQILSRMQNNLVDTNDDGVPDSPEIVVNGPPRFEAHWDHLSVGQKLSWLTAYWWSGGNDQFADIVNKTDISGKNPDNPYQSLKESISDYADQVRDVMKTATDQTHYFVP